MQTIESAAPARAWRVWGAAALVYMVAMLHRTSLSVAGLAAAERFQIGPAQLSSFIVLQIFVYAVMQIPVGLLLDRFGSRRLLAAGIALMTVGQLGFAFVQSYPLALTARALVGLGDATAFLSVLRLAAVWFPPWRNPLLTQFTSLSGQVGALATAIPMAHALRRFGWEPTYLGAALIGVVAAAVMLIVVPNPPATPARTHPPVLASVRACWNDAGTRFGFWAYFAGMFLPNALLLLWGYPWLVEGEGVATSTAPVLLTFLTAASMVSGPAVGVLAGRQPRLHQPLFYGFLLASIALWMAALLWPGATPTWLLALVMTTVGASFAGAMLAFEFARAASPPERVGTALALVNVGGFISTITAVLGIGLILDWLTPTIGRVHAFRVAMALPVLLWGIGLVQMRKNSPASGDNAVARR